MLLKTRLQRREGNTDAVDLGAVGKLFCVAPFSLGRKLRLRGRNAKILAGALVPLPGCRTFDERDQLTKNLPKCRDGGYSSDLGASYSTSRLARSARKLASYALGLRQHCSTRPSRSTQATSLPQASCCSRSAPSLAKRNSAYGATLFAFAHVVAAARAMCLYIHAHERRCVLAGHGIIDCRVGASEAAESLGHGDKLFELAIVDGPQLLEARLKNQFPGLQIGRQASVDTRNNTKSTSVPPENPSSTRRLSGSDNDSSRVSRPAQ